MIEQNFTFQTVTPPPLTHKNPTGVPPLASTSYWTKLSPILPKLCVIVLDCMTQEHDLGATFHRSIVSQPKISRESGIGWGAQRLSHNGRCDSLCFLPSINVAVKHELGCRKITLYSYQWVINTLAAHSSITNSRSAVQCRRTIVVKRLNVSSITNSIVDDACRLNKT